MSTRIPLRRYRLLFRRSFLEIDEDAVLVRLPGIIAGNRPWRVPLSEVAVLDPEAAARVDEPGQGESWVFERDPSIEYAATTTRIASANLRLFFTRPQVMPRLRYFGAGKLGTLGRACRDHLELDGLELRAKEPAAAIEALVAAGVERIDRPMAWQRRHYGITNDPAAIHFAAENKRVGRWVIGLLAVAGAGIKASMVMAKSGRTATWPLLITFAAVVGIIAISARLWAIRQHGRSRDD